MSRYHWSNVGEIARAARPGGRPPQDPPLEHGHVFGDARRAQARDRRAGGATGLVEPAPQLLVERYERLAQQERQPAVGRLVDRHEVGMAATHRRELGAPHGAAHLLGAALTRRGSGVVADGARVGDTTAISTAARRPSWSAVVTVANSPGLSSVAASGVSLKPPGHWPGAAFVERATSPIFVSGRSSITRLSSRPPAPSSSSSIVLVCAPTATIRPECFVASCVVPALLVLARPAPGTSRPASNRQIATYLIGVPPIHRPWAS